MRTRRAWIVDEWLWILGRRGDGLHSLLEPHHGGPTTVAVRRFADAFQPLGTVAAAAGATLRVEPDRASLPWRLSVAPAERVRVCGLG